MASPDSLHLLLALQRPNLKHSAMHDMWSQALTVRPPIQQSTPARSSPNLIFFWHFLHEDLSLLALSTCTLLTLTMASA
eukprot:CAMPEP_0181454410 /NCGR_PEP_ID=MMETSP1110-20121109/30223_1 /TAXON_ID=174948 /ORGANISM="Symbiodinium sp., Strain CCMP421" /LENGTH=78 /DNA_ID=CAMNT_0023578753 /DNA_START=263 /DNA_END=499 /DNA_ORIENTATION=-